MLTPPLPLDEAHRLRSLHSLSILDTPPEDRFDRLLRLAVNIFRVPMATISLVDGERQWFKSRIGIDTPETSREISFCGHAILGEEAMVVQDATQDPRFIDNPLVVEGPRIRFYAGHPLRLPGGHAVGVLCIMDKVPRAFDPRELALFADLACMAEKELGLERSPELYNRISTAEAEARKAFAAKRMFLSNITHELRTPMNGVLGMCQLLMGGHTEAELRDGLETIRQSSESFVSVIDDLLDFANLEIGVSVGRSERFHPADALRRAVDPFQAECIRKGLDLVVDLAQDLPESLIGDAGRLRRIVVNLVGNAVRFTQRGSIRVEARWVDATRTGGELLLRVRNSGPVIRSESLPDSFIGYSPKDGSPNDAGSAGGLGLAITKRLADSMQGSIRVDNGPGGGTGFTLRVRLALDSSFTGRMVPATGGAVLPSQGKDWSPGSDSGASVLLVEDCEINLKVAKRMLEKLGMRVDTAGTGVEALNKLVRHGYSAVFMDCQMPDMDGYEATRAIRGSNAPWARLPIIALTALASPEARLECLNAGMDDHIGKPIRFADLESAVNRHVRK